MLSLRLVYRSSSSNSKMVRKKKRAPLTQQEESKNPGLIPHLLLLSIFFLFIASKFLLNNATSILAQHYTGILQNPKDYQQYISLAKHYNELGFTQEALETLRVAERYSNDSILGANSGKSLQQDLLSQPQKISNKIQYWEEVTNQYPLYRDAWVQLLYIAHLEKNGEEVTKYSELIRNIDPTYLSQLPEKIRHYQ